MSTEISFWEHVRHREKTRYDLKIYIYFYMKLYRSSIRREELEEVHQSNFDFLDKRLENIFWKVGKSVKKRCRIFRDLSLTDRLCIRPTNISKLILYRKEGYERKSIFTAEALSTLSITNIHPFTSILSSIAIFLNHFETSGIIIFLTFHGKKGSLERFKKFILTWPKIYSNSLILCQLIEDIFSVPKDVSK